MLQKNNLIVRDIFIVLNQQLESQITKQKCKNLLNVNELVKNIAEVFVKIIRTAFVIDVFKQCNLKIKNKQTTCKHSDL